MATALLLESRAVPQSLVDYSPTPQSAEMASRASKPRSVESLLDAVLSIQASHDPSASHLQQTPHPVLPPSIENLTLRELVECLNIPPPEKSDPVSSLPAPSVHSSATPIKTSPKSPGSSCIAPVRPSRVNMIVSDRILSQEKSPERETHQKRLETSPEPIICDSPTGKTEHSSQTEEKFWMGSSEKSRQNVPLSTI